MRPALLAASEEGEQGRRLTTHELNINTAYFELHYADSEALSTYTPGVNNNIDPAIATHHEMD